MMKWLRRVFHKHDFRYIGRTERMPLMSELTYNMETATVRPHFGYIKLFECECGARQTDRVWEKP